MARAGQLDDIQRTLDSMQTQMMYDTIDRANEAWDREEQRHMDAIDREIEAAAAIDDHVASVAGRCAAAHK